VSNNSPGNIGAVAAFLKCFIESPRSGEDYNIGGGRNNFISIMDAFQLIEEISGKKKYYEYEEANRIGDHICYISDLSTMNTHYPGWGLPKNLRATF